MMASLMYPPSCDLFIQHKNAEKSRAVFDLRRFNAMQPSRPRKFRLPKFEDIKPLMLTGPVVRDK